MAQSRISYNINGVDLPNQSGLNSHLTKLQPRWSLVMDNVQMGWDMADGFPKTNVILRNWGLTGGDENVYSRLSPDAWLNARIGEAKHGVWLSTANEAGINPEWDIELMHRIVKDNLNVKLVIGNPSVGTPQTDFWYNSEMKEWFRLLYDNRDKYVLGLHEYFAGITPSGFIGGYPDGSWSDGRTNLHPNYEDRRNWPENATNIGMTWHVGRLQVVNAAARSFGYQPPRIVITEHGTDDLGDMKAWLNKFPANGRQNIRGWKSAKNLWERLLPGRTEEEAYFENIKYADQAVYRRYPNVEGQLLFTWSSKHEWNDFDMSEATTFHRLLEDYAGATVVVPPPPPVVIPPTVVTVTVKKQTLTDIEDLLAQAMQKLQSLT